ncbi:hypothetical protein LUL50_000700 [Staphylococcus pseudintermedius]|nr:hypothetical protein [Staphylococcus pseudintermedius]
MTLKKRYYDIKWRYEIHFNDDATKDELIEISHLYIQDLESRIENLEIEELTCETWET